MALIQKISAGAWIATAIVLAISCAASSQESPQKTEAETQTEAQTKTEVVPDTLRSIFEDAVKIFREEKATGEASEQRRERREQSDLIAQNEMARWTFWLAIFALLQLGVTIVTLLFLKKTFEQTKRTADAAVVAANAARLNAQALIHAEGAHILPNVVRSNVDLIGRAVEHMTHPTSWDGKISDYISVTYQLTNHGKTSAVIEEIAHNIVVEPELPKPKVYFPVEPILIDRVMGAGKSSDDIGSARFFKSLTVEECRAIHGMGDNPTTLWFFGYVDYRDMFGLRHRLEHVWWYNGDTRGLRLHSIKEKTRTKNKKGK